MKRKLFNISVLSIALIFVLGGCGSKDKKNKLDETTATATEASTEMATVTTAEPEMEMDENGFYVTNDYVKTVGETINVRINPSTDSPIYVMLEPGKVLNRSGYNEEWTRVIIDNTNFYIFSEFVEETEAPATEEPTTEENASDDEGEEETHKIVIDPANQANINATLEAVGPSGETTKQGASAGDTGPVTGVKESELNLSYAQRLKTELENRGYEVVLTRETNDVDITNKARAEFANEQDADILIRIQMNYSTNSELSGVMALCQSADSPYNSDIYDSCHKLATRLLQGVTTAAGATNHGIYETNDGTLINWSNIPVSVIELGYLSNADDEAKLQSEDYVDNLIKGMADGVDYYFTN